MKILDITLFLTVIFVDIFLAQKRNDVNNSSVSAYTEPTPNEHGFPNGDLDGRTGVNLDRSVNLTENTTIKQRMDVPLSSFSTIVKSCYSRDKQMYNKCLMDFWKKMAPLKTKGIPEINIPQLDPVKVPRVDVNQIGSLVKGEVVITDATISGLSNLLPKNVNVDLEAKTISIELFFPRVIAIGDYSVNCVIMLLPVKGNGAGVIDIHGIDGKIAARVALDGAAEIRLAELHVEYSLSNVSLYLSDLYGGKGVTEVINNLINDNSEELHSDVKPTVIAKVEELISRYVSGLVKLLPADYLLPPEGIAHFFSSTNT